MAAACGMLGWDRTLWGTWDGMELSWEEAGGTGRAVSITKHSTAYRPIPGMLCLLYTQVPYTPMADLLHSYLSNLTSCIHSILDKKSSVMTKLFLFLSHYLLA